MNKDDDKYTYPRDGRSASSSPGLIKKSYQNGRAKLQVLPGKEYIYCDNCGATQATMYALSLAKQPGEDAHLMWILCMVCRSHLTGVFEAHMRAWAGD